MMLSSSRKKGFSLIELMIVIAIMAILAAIAIPTYTGYVGRAQFSEAMSLSSGVKTAIDDAYQNSNTLDGLDSGVDSIPGVDSVKGTYVDRVEVNNGVITSYFSANSSLAEAEAVLQPQVIGNSLIWSCQTTAPPTKTPSQCESVTEIVPIDSD
ncbi:pilin [Salinisphaera aquimarina]|uniref:Pilin n=1 Tax=Salinisphaera aquimarina TaxID=2094031 RepID=A0ABV7EUL2_9GAMM